MKKISIVIPALNEEKTIKDTIIRAKPFCDSILVVLAKRSKDKTAEIAKSLGAEIIRDYGKNGGLYFSSELVVNKIFTQIEKNFLSYVL